jgi:hypothetical protein
VNSPESKKPTGVGLLACVEQGLLTSAGGYVTVEVRSRTDGKILDPAKILRKCKNMAQPHLFLTRRSFYAVGQSCDTNLIPPETRNYGHCEISPTSEGGINSVNVTNCRIRQGAVLPAGTKWLLITGLMERVLGRGSRTALIRRTVGN